MVMRKRYEVPDVECEQLFCAYLVSLSPSVEETEDMYGYEDSEQYADEMEEEPENFQWGNMWY